MIMGLVFLGIFVVLGPTYNFTIALTPEFAKKSLIARILSFQIAGPFERSKYYAIWSLTEGASILTGLGFTDVVNGKPQWDGAANVKIGQIEFAENFKVLLDAWNMKTNVWLRECVYKRVTPKGKKPGNASSMITFMTSAIWHGVSSGYYLSFLLAGFITTAARLVRQNIRPFFASGSLNSPAKRFYDVIGIITTSFILNYAAAPFILLNAEDSIQAWRVLGFYGHVTVLAALAMFYSGGIQYLKGLQKQMGISLPSKGPAKSGTETPIQEKNFVSMPVDKIVPLPEK
jgi:lysophospholipid acyltransferase